MSGFNNIPTPPFKSDFMIVCQNIWMHMDAYRAQQQGYGHPLRIIMSRKVRKEKKPHGENPPSRKEKCRKFKIICLQNIFIFTLMT